MQRLVLAVQIFTFLGITISFSITDHEKYEILFPLWTNIFIQKYQLNEHTPIFYDYMNVTHAKTNISNANAYFLNLSRFIWGALVRPYKPKPAGLARKTDASGIFRSVSVLIALKSHFL